MNVAFLKSFQTLKQVYEGKYSTIALNKTLIACKKQDRVLVTKIVYGVLDNDLKLNYIISRYVHKMPKGDALLFLKLGVYCLTDLSLPVYTVVNDVAELSKISENKHIVGFVNATLKSIAQNAKSFYDYPTDRVEYLSVKYSYPEWALRKLIKDYGEDVAAQIVSFPSNNKTPVRFVSPTTVEQLKERYGVEAEKTVFDDGFFVKGNLPNDGDEYTLQSLSSMAIARICARLTPDDGALLDSCAAPGGKSVYIKQLNPTLRVTSCDIHAHRVELIESYARRMNASLEIFCRDMTQHFEQWDETFNAVLCDVPCSGFGVLDSRPDIKLFRENKDISELMKLQYSILENCSRYVKKGGYLVYSTCTLFDNENGQNIRKFLKAHSEFSFGTIALPEVPMADGKNFYQFLPHKDGMQGFYVAVLKRQ